MAVKFYNINPWLKCKTVFLCKLQVGQVGMADCLSVATVLVNAEVFHNKMFLICFCL